MAVVPFYQGASSGPPRFGDIYDLVPSPLPPQSIRITRSEGDKYTVGAPESFDLPFMRPETRNAEDILVEAKRRRVLVISPDAQNARGRRVLVGPFFSLDNTAPDLQASIRGGEQISSAFAPGDPHRGIARDSYIDFSLIHPVRISIMETGRKIARLTPQAQQQILGLLARYFGANLRRPSISPPQDQQP